MKYRELLTRNRLACLLNGTLVVGIKLEKANNWASGTTGAENCTVTNRSSVTMLICKSYLICDDLIFIEQQENKSTIYSDKIKDYE